MGCWCTESVLGDHSIQWKGIQVVLLMFKLNNVSIQVLSFDLGNNSSCYGIRSRVLEGKLILDDAAMRSVNGSMQHVLDCVPEATNVELVTEIPAVAQLTLNKPISISSAAGGVKLKCPEKGVIIRWGDT